MKDADVRLLLQRLHAHLVNWIQSQPYSFVGFSMGAIIYSAVRPDSSELLQAADRLMYGVKRNGKNQLAICKYDNLGQANGSGCHC
jgi:GGDEF domain-containing protein